MVDVNKMFLSIEKRQLENVIAVENVIKRLGRCIFKGPPVLTSDKFEENSLIDPNTPYDITSLEDR